MTTATPPPAPPAFAGWWRPHKRARWTRLCDGATYDAAWSALLGRLPARNGDSLVTVVGVDPNGQGARRGR
jgi:hypothetical protein